MYGICEKNSLGSGSAATNCLGNLMLVRSSAFLSLISGRGPLKSTCGMSNTAMCVPMIVLEAFCLCSIR